MARPELRSELRLELKLESVKESDFSQGSEGVEEVRGFANLRYGDTSLTFSYNLDRFDGVDVSGQQRGGREIDRFSLCGVLKWCTIFLVYVKFDDRYDNSGYGSEIIIVK